MTAILWDVDTQEDFMDEAGALYVPNTRQVRVAMSNAVAWAAENGVVHVASMDDHEFSDSEIVQDGSADYAVTFPPHCMRGTTGWEKIIHTLQEDPVAFTGTTTPEHFALAMVEEPREVVLLKKNFDVFTVPAADFVLNFYKPETVYVMGVATDICVNAAVNGLNRRGYKVVVIEDAIAGLDEGNTAACLANWKALGVEFVAATDLPEGLA